MKQWTITFTTGAKMTVNAPDYFAAQRCVLNRAGANKLPPVESISLKETDEQKEANRAQAISCKAILDD